MNDNSNKFTPLWAFILALTILLAVNGIIYRGTCDNKEKIINLNTEIIRSISKIEIDLTKLVSYVQKVDERLQRALVRKGKETE